MRLKQDILDVLIGHGATETEIAALIENFASKAAEAEGEVTNIEANIASLQVQLNEAKMRAEATKAGVMKFVDLEP